MYVQIFCCFVFCFFLTHTRVLICGLLKFIVCVCVLLLLWCCGRQFIHLT